MPMIPDDDFAAPGGEEGQAVPRRPSRRRMPGAGAEPPPEQMAEAWGDDHEDFSPPPESLTDFVAARPLGALAIAFISGVVVGRMLF